MNLIINGFPVIPSVGLPDDYVGVPFVADSESALAYLQTGYYYLQTGYYYLQTGYYYLQTGYYYLQTGYYHVHGAAFVLPDKADPVLLTSGAGAWDITGAKTEIIGAGAITKPFDLHWASIWDISGALYGIIDLYAGAALSEVLIGSVDVGRTANFSRESAMPVQIPQQPANTRISARFSSSGAGAETCRLKLYGHVYSTSL